MSPVVKGALLKIRPGLSDNTTALLYHMRQIAVRRVRVPLKSYCATLMLYACHRLGTPAQIDRKVSVV